MENKNLVLIAQFCRHHEVAQAFIASLHEFGLIKIVEVHEEHYLPVYQLQKVEKIIKLHNELGINLEGIDAVNILLDQIETLKQELRVVKNRLLVYDSYWPAHDDNQQRY